MRRRNAVIAFATDEKFVPLAKGLVLSLIALPSLDYDLCLVDIGCSAASLDWMKQNGVSVVRFDEKSIGGISLGEHFRNYQFAQLCRPFLRELIPDYDVYIWCDADIWIQSQSALRNYEMAAMIGGGKMAISPLSDSSYYFTKTDPKEFERYSYLWYEGCFGATLASTYCDLPVLNSGLFALHKESAIWERWKSEVLRVHQQQINSHYVSHLAEQTVLNYILYSSGAFIPLNATHNYNCHAGPVMRHEGVVVIDEPRRRKIGAIHLTYCSKEITNYIDRGLLFDGGNYLQPEERALLSEVNHY